LGGAGTGGLGGSVAEQAGGATVGELLEGKVNLPFELGERARVSRELLGPLFLLLRQRGPELL